MDVIIQSLGFRAGQALENYIRDKVTSLKSDRIIRVNVTLYKGPSGNPDADYCEIRLEMPGNDPFVKKHSPYFETSINECVEVLSQILKKEKDRHVDSRQADAVEIQEAMVQGNDDDVDLEDVVK
jgi:putative sigma-54 modulation protein